MIGVPDTSLGSDAPRALPSDAMTHVELTWIEKKIEFWIRFGREAAEQILDRRGRVVSFVPDSIFAFVRWTRSEEHTSELQSLMRISYAVFCLKKKNKKQTVRTQ